MGCLQPRRIYGDIARKAGCDSVGCGGCKSCVARRKRDLVGALLAESRTASTTWFVTVTFKDDAKAAVFEYGEVQLLLKRVRETYADQGISVRFFCAGEFGSLYGRAHWHLLLFFRGGVPVRPWINEGELWALWPHGWSRLEDLKHSVVGRARYCVMYALKDTDSEGFNVYRGSNATPLGSDYFEQLADRTAKAGLVPDGAYTFAESRFDRGKHAGQLVQHRLRGVARDNFVRCYAAAWVKYHPGTPIPSTEWLEMVWPESDGDVLHREAIEYADLEKRCAMARFKRYHIVGQEQLELFHPDQKRWQAFRNGGSLLIACYDTHTKVVWIHKGGAGEIWRADVRESVNYCLDHPEVWEGFVAQDFQTRRVQSIKDWLVNVQ